MKRFKRFMAVVAVIATLLLPGAAFAQGFYYWFQAEDEYGRPFTTDYAVGCTPYVRGTGSVATVYTDAGLGTAFSPSQTSAGVLYSNASGIVHFWTSSATTYDVACFSRFGGSGRIAGLGRSHHRMPLKTDGQVSVRFPFSTSADNTVVTGITIPQGSVIKDVLVELRQGYDGAHINVGIAGNDKWSVPNALIHRLAITQSAPIWQRPHVEISTATAPPSGATYLSAVHRGSLLSVFRAGSASNQDGTQGPHIGLYAEVPLMVHQGAGVTFQYNTSNVAGMGGHVYVIFERSHVGSSMPISIFGR